MSATLPVVDAPTPSIAGATETWEYLVVPLPEAKGLKKSDEPWTPERLDALGADGWEAVGLSLKYGDLMAWPVVLLKRPLS